MAEEDVSKLAIAVTAAVYVGSGFAPDSHHEDSTSDAHQDYSVPAACSHVTEHELDASPNRDHPHHNDLPEPVHTFDPQRVSIPLVMQQPLRRYSHMEDLYSGTPLPLRVAVEQAGLLAAFAGSRAQAAKSAATPP